MTDRLSPLDASFLFMEEPTTAMHVGGLMTFDAAPGFDPDRFIALIGERLAAVPRYRQKIREVPARLGLPLWVDDPAFELDFHVRRSALPAPGSDEQLRELVGRLQSRQLDRSRPLWEIYLIEGLDRNRFAIVTKTHHAMVDGLSSIDIGAVLLDVTPTPRESPPDDWHPAPEPSDLVLAADAVREQLLRPGMALGNAQRAASDVRSLMRTGGAMLAAARSASRPAPANPLNAPIGRQRRFGTSAGALDDYKAIRKEHGGTVNDVILAVVTGGLRRWMTTRGEPVLTATTVRALVPVSVRARGTGGTVGNQISALFVDLPVGEADPVARLKVVSAVMAGHKGSGQALGAGALIGLVGLATPTVHSMGARLTSSMSSRMFNVIVTNVPGPQFPLYAMGARMRDIYPVVPLAKGQAVSIGISSYDGGVFYGLNADRDAMGDVDVLAGAIGESLDELRGSA
jgi:diacylglycerol O-acyltransferase